MVCMAVLMGGLGTKMTWRRHEIKGWGQCPPSLGKEGSSLLDANQREMDRYGQGVKHE